MSGAALVWLLWFVLSFGAFVALETHAIESPAHNDTLSAQMKRLLARRRDTVKAAFLMIWCGGFAVLGAHFLGWLG